MRCCICGKEIKGYGNNPKGAMWKDKHGDIVEAKFDADCRCCDECNQKYVIAGRLYLLTKKKSIKQMLEEQGMVDIEYYSLINNYGYTFKDKEGKTHDLRFMANCYGACPNKWSCDIKEIEKLANEIREVI